jgi:hypothetical protein
MACRLNTKFEQNLAAAIRFQRLLERFLELLKRVDMFHCGGERSISYKVAQLLVSLLYLCSGRVAYRIDEPDVIATKLSNLNFFIPQDRHSSVLEPCRVRGILRSSVRVILTPSFEMEKGRLRARDS